MKATFVITSIQSFSSLQFFFPLTIFLPLTSLPWKCFLFWFPRFFNSGLNSKSGFGFASAHSPFCNETPHPCKMKKALYSNKTWICPKPNVVNAHERTILAYLAWKRGTSWARSLSLAQVLLVQWHRRVTTRTLNQRKEHILNSMYVKKLKAPPLAPLLTNLSRSTQSFISFGKGRAFLSIKSVRRMRVSVRNKSQVELLTSTCNRKKNVHIPMWLHWA